MVNVGDAKDYRSQLEALRDVLAEEIDARPGARDLASLAQRYAETVKQLETLPDTTKAKSAAETIAEKRKTRRATTKPTPKPTPKPTAKKTTARKPRVKKPE